MNDGPARGVPAQNTKIVRQDAPTREAMKNRQRGFPRARWSREGDGAAVDYDRGGVKRQRRTLMTQGPNRRAQEEQSHVLGPRVMFGIDRDSLPAGNAETAESGVYLKSVRCRLNHRRHVHCVREPGAQRSEINPDVGERPVIRRSGQFRQCQHRVEP